MFVEKMREEMYDIISKERVLVLVTMDVDALCACKILQWLFKCDNVEYTLLPVNGKDDLIKAYTDHAEQIKHVFLINCGGNMNILELLQPVDDVMFYIVDSHRPLDLDNIYNQDQIKILMKEGETLEVPEFDDIYASSDEEGDDDSEEEGTPLKRRRTEDSESPHKSKKEKRLWLKKRQSILYQYYENAFHGTSSAMILFELCWKMSKDSNLVLWWSIVGLTDQLINERIDNEKYVADAQTLHQHVLRLNHTRGNGTSINCMKISFDHELRLALYRHWSIFESLCHSSFTVYMFRVWTMKGKRRLHEFLAELGLPLHQCRQKYSAMDVKLRNSFKDSIIQIAEKYGLEEIMFGSFNVQMGYKNKHCASDVAFAITALLENTSDEEKSFSDNFLDALDALTWSPPGLEKLHTGLELSKKHVSNFNHLSQICTQPKTHKLQQICDIFQQLVTTSRYRNAFASLATVCERQLVAIWDQVHSVVSTHQVVCAGPFLYAYVREGAADMKVFSTPTNVTRLATFLLNCYVIMSKNKRAATLPFIMAAPLDAEAGTCVVVGIPPVADDTRKNFLGRAFEMAAEKTKARSRHDHCEPSGLKHSIVNGQCSPGSQSVALSL